GEGDRRGRRLVADESRGERHLLTGDACGGDGEGVTSIFPRETSDSESLDGDAGRWQGRPCLAHNPAGDRGASLLGVEHQRPGGNGASDRQHAPDELSHGLPPEGEMRRYRYANP